MCNLYKLEATAADIAAHIGLVEPPTADVPAADDGRWVQGMMSTAATAATATLSSQVALPFEMAAYPRHRGGAPVTAHRYRLVSDQVCAPIALVPKALRSQMSEVLMPCLELPVPVTKFPAPVRAIACSNSLFGAVGQP